MFTYSSFFIPIIQQQQRTHSCSSLIAPPLYSPPLFPFSFSSCNILNLIWLVQAHRLLPHLPALLVSITKWVARLEKAALASFTKACCIEFPPKPFPYVIRQRHTRPDNSLFCSKHYTGTNLISNQQIAIKFESRKSEAPQLRDEYRTYKILSGVGMCQGERKKWMW